MFLPRKIKLDILEVENMMNVVSTNLYKIEHLICLLSVRLYVECCGVNGDKTKFMSWSICILVCLSLEK